MLNKQRTTALSGDDDNNQDENGDEYDDDDDDDDNDDDDEDETNLSRQTGRGLWALALVFYQIRYDLIKLHNNAQYALCLQSTEIYVANNIY